MQQTPSQQAYLTEYDIATGVRQNTGVPFTASTDANIIGVTDPVGTQSYLPPPSIGPDGSLFNSKVILGATNITIDSGSNIQKALDSLNAVGGGTLYLKAGTYIVSTTLTGYSSISIIGTSPTATIINFNSTSGHIAFAGTNVYNTGTITSISSGVNVVGSGTTWTAAMAGRSFFIGTRWYTIASVTDATHLTLAESYGDNVTLPGASYRIASIITDITIQGVGLKNSTGTAITFDDCRRITVSNVQLITNNKGIVATNCAEYASDRTESVASTSDGITLTNVGLINWSSVNPDGNGGNGFTFNNVKTGSLSGCAADSNTADGLNLTTVVDMTMLIEASGNGGQGIEFVSGCDNCDVVSGTIQSNTSDGIKMTASTTNCHIYGCDITNNGGYGVNIAVSGDSNNIFTTNNFASNTSGAINDLGTGTLIRGNTGVNDNATSSSGNITQSFTCDENISANNAVVISDGTIITGTGFDAGITNDRTIAFGDGTNSQKMAFKFTTSSAFNAGGITVFLQTQGSPADNVTFAIQADSSGSPSGSNLASGTISSGSLTGSQVNYTLNFTSSTQLSNATQYWIVLGRSGSVDAANYYRAGGKTTGTSAYYYNGSTWSALNISGQFTVLIASVAGHILQASANTTGRYNNFIGFAISAITSGNSGSVYIGGLPGGFSGLTAGSLYYLSNTLGAISTSPGANTRKVGIATSTTQLLITNIW